MNKVFQLRARTDLNGVRTEATHLKEVPPDRPYAIAFDFTEGQHCEFDETLDAFMMLAPFVDGIYLIGVSQAFFQGVAAKISLYNHDTEGHEVAYQACPSLAEANYHWGLLKERLQGRDLLKSLQGEIGEVQKLRRAEKKLVLTFAGVALAAIVILLITVFSHKSSTSKLQETIDAAKPKEVRVSNQPEDKNLSQGFIRAGFYAGKGDRWRKVEKEGAPGKVAGPCVVWAPEIKKVIVWGGHGQSSYSQEGAAYNVESGEWDPYFKTEKGTAANPRVVGNETSTGGIWTGSHFLILRRTPKFGPGAKL